MKRILYLAAILTGFIQLAQAQITAPQSDASDFTQYPVFTETDPIFFFCSQDSSAANGALTITTALSGTKTFLWEVYNPQTGAFDFYFQESTDAASSQISNLPNGCYRATVTLGSTTSVYRAWVFNNWTVALASVSDINCESFKLNGSFRTSSLNYYDLSSNAPVEIFKDVRAEWLEGSVKLGSVLSMTNYDPPTKNTDYTLRIYDKYGCEGRSTVTYESVVTKAGFTASPMDGEAPLTVTFNNTSENGTAGFYEWYFYRDIDEIKEDAENSNGQVDSILVIAYDDAPVYTYQFSGNYLVKLISKHVTNTLVCTDTFIIQNFIKVDTSFVRAPNVFTPNGDGVNDEFTIYFYSMKNLEINIYNRWGKRVHYWSSGNIDDPDNARTESVWDGKVNGRTASPGVYYYDVTGRGRDDRKQSKHGFVHLFREKD